MVCIYIEFGVQTNPQIGVECVVWVFGCVKNVAMREIVVCIYACELATNMVHFETIGGW